MRGAAGIPSRGRLEVLVQLSSLRSRHVWAHLHRDRAQLMVGSTGRRKHMRRLQHVPYSLGCMLMDTLMLTWLSTRFEATAHSAVRGKELGEVECHKWRHPGGDSWRNGGCLCF